MTELPQQVLDRIEKEAQECGGSNYVKNHMPKTYADKYMAYKIGATAEAVRAMKGSVRTLQMIKHEIERLQKEQDERKFTLQEMIDCWQAGCHSSMEMDFYFKDRFNIDINKQ